jgi:hypothetical protein
MTGGKGRAFVYDWNRNRLRRIEEEQQKKKKREEEARKFSMGGRHPD